MNSLPTLSLVTPNYNGADHLQACLTSVLGQNVDELEYVLVDGASTDGSGLIIRQFEDRLSHTIIEPDKGHADALNKGFARTSGEIMGWLNSDDMLFDGTLQVVQRLFAAYPEIEWITGRASSMNAAGEVTQIMPARPWSRLRMLCGDQAFIQQESTFWRRSLWERTGGQLDGSLQLANDFDLWMRFFREAELHTIDRYLGCFRVRPGQRSVVQAKRYREETRQVIAREMDRLEPGFKAAFGHLLPDQPREPSDTPGELPAGALAACDPPIIKPTAVNRRMVQLDRSAAAAPASAPVSAAMFTPSDRTAFRNKHAGERCFILGNGPSLNETDLSLLKGETVFGCNGVFLLFDRIDWRPAYYTCVDTRVLPDRAADIKAMLDADPDMNAFFPARLDDHTGGATQPTRALIPDGPGRYFFSERAASMANPPWSMFSPDPGAYLVQPHTVTITMLQLAAHMGFSEIYLVGCDTAYRLSDTVSQETGEKEARAALTSTEDNDINHFDPRYFGSGRRWHVPDLVAMIAQYTQARTALEAQGVRVCNATVGGELDVFDRISLEDAVQRSKRSERSAPRTPAQAATEPTGMEQTGAAAPAAWRSVIANNGSALAGAGVVGLITALGIFLAPGAAAKIAVAGVALGLSGLAVASMVAIKTRRIVLTLIKHIETKDIAAAKREITVIELGARIDEIEYKQAMADNAAAQAPENAPDRGADAG